MTKRGQWLLMMLFVKVQREEVQLINEMKSYGMMAEFGVLMGTYFE